MYETLYSDPDFTIQLQPGVCDIAHLEVKKWGRRLVRELLIVVPSIMAARINPIFIPLRDEQKVIVKLVLRLGAKEYYRKIMTHNDELVPGAVYIFEPIKGQSC